jgi:carbamoyl-phosphate synthase large subunit
MNKLIKVLVTGAGSLLGQGIIRSLINSKLKIHLTAVDPDPLAVGLYWADSKYLIPMVNDREYFGKLKDILRLSEPDVVLVGTDVELPIFAKYKELLEKEFNTRIIVSSSRVIDIANDKYLTYKYLKEAGFAYPETVLPENIELLLSNHAFPFIVKPRIGARSIGVYKANDIDQLHQLLQSDSNVVIQECVGSSQEEYTASALTFDGKCYGSIVMRRELRDGNTYKSYVEQNEVFNREIQTIAADLSAFGPANFQFRLDGSTIKIFEINARFSGTTPLRALAGFNEVEMCIRKILFDEQITQPQIETMTILRYWSEYIVK